MAYQPEQPFPKGRGNAIRAKDWNDAIGEVVRLDQAKLNQAGGTVSGNLAVTGNLSANGTISGNLAANIVGTNQIADGSVTNAKLAAGAVTPDKIQANTIPVDRLLGQIGLPPFTFTLDGVVGAAAFVWMGETVITNPSSASQPLVFMSSPQQSAFFDYSFDYRRTTSFAGEQVGGHMLRVVNRSAFTTQITVSSFYLRLR